MPHLGNSGVNQVLVGGPQCHVDILQIAFSSNGELQPMPTDSSPSGAVMWQLTSHHPSPGPSHPTGSVANGVAAM